MAIDEVGIMGDFPVELGYRIKYSPILAYTPSISKVPDSFVLHGFTVAYEDDWLMCQLFHL